MKNEIIVFYDGACGMCSKEISYYRRVAPAGIFRWVDVNESEKELAKEQISLVEGLKLLHVKDSNGQMHVGVDGFIVIWKQLKWWRFLAMFVSMPGVKHLTAAIYGVFAKWRFGRLKHCQLAAKMEDEK